jgi:stress response protein SCP2
MHLRSKNESRPSASEVLDTELKEVVLGLHWAPAQGGAAHRPADLDALCVLFDSDNRVLEVVHPGCPRSTDGSITHTGDSKNGASTWDDERIFVFLNALPKNVDKLAFVVLGSTDQPFDQVPGAFCHVSDRLSEAKLAHMDLTSLAGQAAYAITILRCGESGWKIATDAVNTDRRLFKDLRRLIQGSKSTRQN